MQPCKHTLWQRLVQDGPQFFGSDTDSAATVFLRHGIFGNPSTFHKLAQTIPSKVAKVEIRTDNQPYCWQCPILRNGIVLADQIKAACHQGRRIVIIGHSMGGLVGRVALVALQRWEEFKTLLSQPTISEMWPRDAWGLIKNAEEEFEPPTDGTNAIRGLITLATPNSGAFCNFGIANLANLLPPHARLVGKVAGVGIDFLVDQLCDMSMPSVQDLTSDRVFRFFQQLGPVPGPPVLSVSGSFASAISNGGVQGMRVLDRGLRMSGLHNSLPHDVVVENSSVDLRHSCLPNEIVDSENDSSSRYEHRRAYLNCIDVHHCNICEREEIESIVLGKLSSWL